MTEPRIELKKLFPMPPEERVGMWRTLRDAMWSKDLCVLADCLYDDHVWLATYRELPALGDDRQLTEEVAKDLSAALDKACAMIVAMMTGTVWLQPSPTTNEWLRLMQVGGMDAAKTRDFLLDRFPAEVEDGGEQS